MSEKSILNTHEQLEPRALILATLVYLIQAISLITLVPFLIAAITSVDLIQATSLITLVPFLIGVIINYVKLNDVRGTLVESHFRWQIRTFLFSILWMIVGFTIAVAYNLLLWFMGFGWALLVYFSMLYLVSVTGWLWVAYRVIRGWMALVYKRQPF